MPMPAKNPTSREDQSANSRLAGGRPCRTRASGQSAALFALDLLAELSKTTMGAGPVPIPRADASAGADCQPWVKGSATRIRPPEGERGPRVCQAANLDKRTRVRGRAVLPDFHRARGALSVAELARHSLLDFPGPTPSRARSEM